MLVTSRPCFLISLPDGNLPAGHLSANSSPGGENAESFVVNEDPLLGNALDDEDWWWHVPSTSRAKPLGSVKFLV